MSVVSDGCRIDPRTKRMITLMDRINLEDKYIELYEENILLKKHAKGQEEKMKRLGTKLIKLSSDNKRTWKEGEADELELKLHEANGKLSKLETQNANLKGKISILKHQLALSWKRTTPYSHVTSKTNSGLGRRKSLSFSTETLSYKSKTVNSSTQVSPGPLRYGHSLLEVARKDNEELEEIVLKLKEELTVLKIECERLEENNKLQSVSHEETILKLQEKIQTHINDKQRHILEEDVEKIRLQREVQSKSVSLQQATTNCQSLQKELTIMTNKCKSLTTDVTGLKTQLHEEQMISKDLLSKMKECSIEKRSLAELQDMLTDVKYEKELLKERNDRLTKSLLKSMGDTTVTGRIDDKNTIDRINNEMKFHYEQQLNESREEAQRTLDELKKEKKLRVMLEEQVLQLKDEHTLLKKKKERETVLVSTKEHDRPRNIGSTEEVDDLRLALDKNKRLLALQSKISSDYKKELEILQNEIKERQKENGNLKQILDMKNDKIKKLESRLTEVAYRRNRPYTEHIPVPISRTEMFEVQSNSTINTSINNNKLDNKPLEEPDINNHSTRTPSACTSPPQTAPHHVTSHSPNTHFTPASAAPSTTPHSHSPTHSPTGLPTLVKTGSTTRSPVGSPTHSPTGSPTHSPTGSPTHVKTGSPTHSPFGSPTHSPTDSPTRFKTGSPTHFNTASPTHSPTGSLNVSSDVCSSLKDSLEVTPSPPVSPHGKEKRDRPTVDDNVTDDTLFGDSSFEEEDIPLPDVTPTDTLSSTHNNEPSMSEDEVKYKDGIAVLLHNANDLLSTEPNTEEVFFSLTIISFTLEEDATVISDANINNIFVEYSFLDYDIDLLETPVSLPKPPPGQPAIFNFTTDFHILPMSNSMNLLQEFLLSSEAIIQLNLVHDPQEEDDNDNIECQELGTANLKLLEILQSEEGDSVIIDEDVLSVADPDEMMGFLTIQISGLKSLKQLSDKLIKK